MKIHEYQARDLLKQAGIAVPAAEVARSVDEAVAAFHKFGGQMVVVKAQVYAGGRGKAGFVKLCNTADEVKKAA
ncbi:MAG: acetate--CoA ligase family protein, partial [Tepidisphaeraceae bacterium]